LGLFWPVLALACGPAQDFSAARIWDEPALFETDPSALARGLPALTDVLRRVPDTSLTILTPEQAIVLLNDLWGVRARLHALGTSSAEAHAFDDAEARVRAVILGRAGTGPPWICPGAPTAAAEHLPAAEGWREAESEMPVLSHERAFALRRLFRVFVRGSERALVSQLVFVDAAGTAHLSCVAGEIELLDVGPEGARSARLFELERHARGLVGTLVEVAEVARVPGLGADRFFLEPPAVPLGALPCRSCHDDDHAMSLFSLDLPVGRRLPSLLTQAAAEHAR
jgi:hypothetical protein